MKTDPLTLTFPDIVTFLNISLGFSAIAASALKHWDVASTLLIGAVVMDYLDGHFARALNVVSELGVHLDSLSDLVSFGVAPAFWLLSKYNYSPLLWGAGLILISCGAYRLGRYNLLHKTVRGGWIGMPITLNAIILPVMGYLTSNVVSLTVFVLLVSFLMVSKIKFKRLL